MLMLHLRRLFVACLLSLCLCGIAAGQDAVPKPSISEKIAADGNKLDLNTATPQQLKSLPGMGDAYVKRIVDGRPYTAKNQLVTRGILPQAAYEQIKEQIIAHRPKKQTEK
jgi:DNA uptake protein ComE-like DNA-binding protein